MKGQRSLKLGSFIMGSGFNVGSWRHPEAVPDASVNLAYLTQLTKKSEEGKLDFVFFADSLYISERTTPNYLERLEAITTVSALAANTSKIGLVATLSTSFSEPFNTARQFASIDVISNGRAGWNVVTSALDGTQLNYGGEKLMEHDLRYQVADEYVEVVKGLWDSWEDDAFIRDKSSGIFADLKKMHRLNHKGEFFSVQGPLNIPRSKQGRPIIFQAGASKAGKEFAAKHAEVVFLPPVSYEEAKQIYKDIKGLAMSFGRSEKDILILPSLRPIVGRTEEEAEQKYQEIAKLADIETSLNFMCRFFADIDLKQFELDKPFPDIWDYAKNGWEGIVTNLKKRVSEHNLTLRQAALELTTPRDEFTGTPDQVADQMQKWFEGRAADGFMLLFALNPSGLNDFVDEVLPVLRERGLFKSEYEFDTLRGNLGLSKPENRYTLSNQMI
ncbi:LLM class flavin-dependent oxidoreductase [Gottfriedia acidiceleris]|uniref:LLM class flavin-dependent oxidoreductase n=1 Tax=Gottfriedia acidiceleris TaxID=371036 RepID=UPI003D1C147F